MDLVAACMKVADLLSSSRFTYSLSLSGVGSHVLPESTMPCADLQQVFSMFDASDDDLCLCVLGAGLHARGCHHDSDLGQAEASKREEIRQYSYCQPCQQAHQGGGLCHQHQCQGQGCFSHICWWANVQML